MKQLMINGFKKHENYIQMLLKKDIKALIVIKPLNLIFSAYPFILIVIPEFLTQLMQLLPKVESNFLFNGNKCSGKIC